VSGGVARDLLTLQVPSVLRSELYAVAALGGAGSVALGVTGWACLPCPWQRSGPPYACFCG